MQALDYHVSSYGVLSPNIEELSFQVPGSIEKFLVDEGDRVLKGELLAQLEDAQGHYEQGHYEQVKIAHAQATLRLERCYLLASDDGVILQEIVDSRTSISPGRVIYAFHSDQEAWKVDVGLIDWHVFTFHKGSPATMTFAPYPGEVFQGSLTRLAGMADAQTGLFLAEVSIRPEGRPLRPGMLATVDLMEKSEQQYPVLPMGSLTRLREYRATI